MSVPRRRPHRKRDENQWHAAVVELVNARLTPRSNIDRWQNWYPGNSKARGIYNLSPRAAIAAETIRRFPDQVETGSRFTENIRAASCAETIRACEFYSIAISNGHQQVDSGHQDAFLSARTPPADQSPRASRRRVAKHYRGLVTAHRKATGARNLRRAISM